MKILLFANSPIYLSKFKQELINELAKNFEVHLVPALNYEFGNNSRIKNHHNITIIRRKISIFRDFATVITIYRLIRSIRPDIVLSFTIKPNIIAGFFSRILKFKSIQVISGLGSAYYRNNLSRMLYVLLYKMANYDIRCFENYHDESIFKANGLAKNSIVFNGSGVNLNLFKVKDYPTNNTFNFLFVGRLMVDKGINELVYAFEKTLENGYEAQLTVVGASDDDINRVELFKNPNIKLLGYVEDVRKYLESADVVVNPSYHEGLSNVLLEASAIGRPLIASNIPGCRELIDDGVNGYLTAPGDVESLFRAMEKFIKIPREIRDKMGKASRVKVEKSYDRKSVVMKYLEIIDQIKLYEKV